MWKQLGGDNNNPDERQWGLGTGGEKWSDSRGIQVVSSNRFDVMCERR